MNDDFEELLRTVPLAPPSADFNRRMQAMLVDAAGSQRPSVFRWAILFGLPAAALTVGLVLFTVHAVPRPAAAAAPVVQRIEPAGLMREFLLTPPVQAAPPPALELSVRL